MHACKYLTDGVKILHSCSYLSALNLHVSCLKQQFSCTCQNRQSLHCDEILNIKSQTPLHNSII